MNGHIRHAYQKLEKRMYFVLSCYFSNDLDTNLLYKFSVLPLLLLPQNGR